MKIILFIEDEQLVKNILKHRHLFDVKCKPALCAKCPPAGATIFCEASLTPGLDDYRIDRAGT